MTKVVILQDYDSSPLCIVPAAERPTLKAYELPDELYEKWKAGLESFQALEKEVEAALREVS